ncbi:MAG TPA: SUMF1/EgtB/PvdO family nonheme iron enzyme [Kiritimatiellia bacterium]|nr:SUMF1/EgtB/PvdO family nonheme iron enzyme [Kiritimatiellia bacterium]
MSKPSFIKISLLAALAVPTFGAGEPRDARELLARAILIRGGVYHTGSYEADCFPPRQVVVADFYLWPTEVTESWWKAIHEDQAQNADPNQPATGMTHQEAEAFCRKLSEHYQITVRLPSADEWQIAARAGTPGVTYPWGWGLPAGRAAFDAKGPAAVGTYPPNPLGFYDMAGNVAEWVLADSKEDHAPVMGGSWAERDPRYLRISHRLILPKSYRDRDVGFRFLIEAPANN